MHRISCFGPFESCYRRQLPLVHLVHLLPSTLLSGIDRIAGVQTLLRSTSVSRVEYATRYGGTGISHASLSPEIRLQYRTMIHKHLPFGEHLRIEFGRELGFAAALLA